MVKFKVTPTQLAQYRAASKSSASGNLSGWLKELANEKIPKPVSTSERLNPRRML